MSHALTVFISLFFWVLCLIFIVGWSIKNGISPMPSTRKAKAAMLSLIPLNQTGTLYELGAGWGTLLIPLGKRYICATIIGFETSAIPFWVGRIRLWIHQFPHVFVKRMDFFEIDLSEASIVVCYLYPEAMRRLKLKMEKELKPGTLVISNTFAIPGWTPLKTLNINDLYSTHIYLYRL